MALRHHMGVSKRSSDSDSIKAHFPLVAYEATMVILRRFLLNDMGSQSLTNTAIVLTAIEGDRPHPFSRATSLALSPA